MSDQTVPTYQQPSPEVSDAANRLVDWICNDEKIAELIDAKASKLAGVHEWTAEQWEQGQNSPEYQLYYAYLSELHQKVCATAILQLGHHNL